MVAAHRLSVLLARSRYVVSGHWWAHHCHVSGSLHLRSVNIDQLLVYSVRPLSIHSRGATGHGASTKYAARPLSIHSVRSMAWPVCPLLIYSVGSTDTRSVDAASINNCHSPAIGVLLLASI